jgi:hypothetical protein
MISLYNWFYNGMRIFRVTAFFIQDFPFISPFTKFMLTRDHDLSHY